MKQYIVDAFAEEVFSGNPAAICVMEQWLPEKLMMQIARENNFSETAFLVKEGKRYKLRWFTPGGEIDLCGHATLASAYVISHFVEEGAAKIEFHTMSGVLKVRVDGDLYEMDFPAYKLKEVPVTGAIEEALGIRPEKAYMGRDLLCIYPEEETVRRLKPDQEKMRVLDGLLVHVTAPGKEFDCVSRSFGPKCGVAEDPVCGSGHCHIVPYWADALGKNKLTAWQASERGGTLYCEISGDVVKLAGKAVLFAEAEIRCGI